MLRKAINRKYNQLEAERKKTAKAQREFKNQLKRTAATEAAFIDAVDKIILEL